MMAIDVAVRLPYDTAALRFPYVRLFESRKMYGVGICR